MNIKTKGILCILFSAFCFALMNTFVRLSGNLPSIQKSFFRNLIALIVAGFILRKEHITIKCKKENLKFMIMRAFCGTLGILCNFYAVDHLVLSDASMLNKMSPFFSILFSAFFLKEKVNRFQIFAVIGAFIGSLFIIKPTFSNLELVPAFIGLLGGIGAGAAYTVVRYLGSRGEKGPVIVFFFSAFSCIVTVPYILFAYSPMSVQQIGYLLLAGLAATGGQFGITAAYCYAPAKDISIYDYAQILFAAIIGYFLFSQIPDIYSILGYFIICFIAISMFVYQKKEKKMLLCAEKEK